MRYLAALSFMLALACGEDELRPGGALSCVASTPMWPGDCVDVGTLPQEYRGAVTACDRAFYACQTETCDADRRACVEAIPGRSAEELGQLDECDRERSRCIDGGGGLPCSDAYLACVDI